MNSAAIDSKKMVSVLSAARLHREREAAGELFTDDSSDERIEFQLDILNTEPLWQLREAVAAKLQCRSDQCHLWVLLLEDGINTVGGRNVQQISLPLDQGCMPLCRLGLYDGAVVEVGVNQIPKLRAPLLTANKEATPEFQVRRRRLGLLLRNSSLPCPRPCLVCVLFSPVSVSISIFMFIFLLLLGWRCILRPQRVLNWLWTKFCSEETQEYWDGPTLANYFKSCGAPPDSFSERRLNEVMRNHASRTLVSPALLPWQRRM